MGMYVRRPQTVEAWCWDGTTTKLHEIDQYADMQEVSVDEKDGSLLLTDDNDGVDRCPIGGYIVPDNYNMLHCMPKELFVRFFQPDQSPAFTAE